MSSARLPLFPHLGWIPWLSLKSSNHRFPRLVSPRVPPEGNQEAKATEERSAQDHPSSSRWSPARAGTLVTCGGAASPGSGRPWLRGPQVSTLGHASGSVPPGARRAAPRAEPRSLGQRVTWAGSGRASQPRVTLYLRSDPRALTSGTRGHPVIQACVRDQRASRIGWPIARALLLACLMDRQTAQMPLRRSFHGLHARLSPKG